VSALGTIDVAFVCLAAHDWESPRILPENVKLLLPPRQSRGISRVGLVEIQVADNTCRSKDEFGDSPEQFDCASDGEKTEHPQHDGSRCTLKFEAQPFELNWPRGAFKE